MKFGVTCFATIGLLACASVALAQKERIYVPPEPDMPVFEIGPIQIDMTKRHDPQVVVQWRMTRVQKAFPAVMAITGERKLNLLLTGVGGKQFGTLRFDYEGSTQKPAAVAIWFEMPQKRAGTCLVSNVQTLGVIDPEELPKIAAPQEAADFAAKKIKRAPPKEVPAGFVALTNQHRIVPGMPIKAAFENQWYDAEVLAIDTRGWISARYDVPEKTIRILPTFHALESSWFAAEPKTIVMAQNSPRRFRPSVAVLPGTTAIIPEDYVPLPPINLPPGLPVQYALGVDWRDGLVLRADETQVEIQRKFAGQLSKSMVPRGQIIVTQEDAKRAGGRTATRFYAEKLAELQADP
ncbi:MAG: hypothetical protein WBD20_13135 [Pirellulaceae bacterium]